MSAPQHRRDGGTASRPGPVADGALDTATEMIAAVRRGDEPGAELALSRYLAGIERDPAEPAAGMPAGLRHLIMKMAEVAAEQPA